MDLQEINKRIKSLKGRNASIVSEVQELGLACLMQIEQHGNTTPLNDLIDALTRSQVKAFSEWALAYGKVKLNKVEERKLGKFFAYDKTRSTDIEAATANVWDNFAPEKGESAAQAFDLQAAVARVLKKAAEAGKPQSMIDELAKAVGIESAKVPKSVAAIAAESETAPL